MRRSSKVSNSSSSSRSDKVMLKKGPWSSEEDEVLVKFVNKHGPKDWSSIHSMGLLPRSGKSCRLRWVNKLRPNLKLGCKFTPEEEKLVIGLQERFGNKWATIASYLHGRTDNDVKNFWSTRQKRLARLIILTPPPPPPPPTGQGKTLLQFQSQPEFLIPDSMIAGLDFNSLSPLHESNMDSPPLPPSTAITTDENPVLDSKVIPAETGEGGAFLDEFPASCCYEATQQLPWCCCCDETTSSSMEGMLEWKDDEKEEIEELGTPDGFFNDLPPDIFDCIDPPPPPSTPSPPSAPIYF